MSTERNTFSHTGNEPLRGLEIKDTDADGNERTMRLLHNSTGFLIEIVSQYVGEPEPTINRIALSDLGLHMLTALLLSAPRLPSLDPEDRDPQPTLP